MDNNNYYNNNQNNSHQGERRGLAIASIITGILSIPMACLSYPAILFGLLGLLFGIFSKGNAEKRSSAAIAGIITGSVGLALGIAITVYSMYILKNNPDILNSYSQILDFYNKK